MKKITKIIALALTSMAMVTALAACGETEEPGPENPNPPIVDPTPVERPTEQETRAKKMVEIVFENYAVEGGSGDTAYINFKENYGSNQSGYLWSNFSAAGMQYYMCKLYPDSQEEKDTFRKMINNFLYFRQKNGDQGDAVKYHSGRGNAFNGGSGDCFFDDNIWVARNYLRAYEIFGDEFYLEEAIRVNNWVRLGWNNELGGLVWSENGLSDSASEQHLERGLSANACGIMVNAMLSDYAEGQEKQDYMDWAEKFYNFCKKMQNKPDTYDYWNGIHTVIENGVRKDGAINRVHYSYNSGSMILADLLMYDRTTDAAKKADYMDDAIGTSAAAKKTFNMLDPGKAQLYYSGDPWFACILNEAYYELRNYTEDRAEPYLKSFDNNAKYAFKNRDPETGLFPYQATQTFTLTNASKERWVIHQVGVAEQAVISALWSIEG